MCKAPALACHPTGAGAGAGAVTDAFVKLYEDGLIYRGTYMVNWAPKLQTAVSDLEVEYSDEQGFLYVFRYPLADGGGAHLPVATTRPETILGDTAVAVHPDDPRYADMVGQEVEVPMSGGRRIPVIADTYVDMEFGTGALKITPAHDPNDYAIGQRVGLSMLTVMNRDGSMNSSAGKYSGMDRFECRKQLWADMQNAGLAVRKEAYTNRCVRHLHACVPHMPSSHTLHCWWAERRKMTAMAPLVGRVQGPRRSPQAHHPALPPNERLHRVQLTNDRQALAPVSHSDAMQHS